MAKDKKGFILYTDQRGMFDKLPNDKAGELIKHIFSYVNDENPVCNDLVIDIAFEPIMQSLKRDLKKYESKCLKNKENAKKRWDKKDANVCERIKTDAKNADRDNDNDNDNDTDKEINIVFDDFWNLYNKKVGSKNKCETKWNKLKDEQREKIILSLPNWLKQFSDKQFQPYPETYLNNERWNDEIINTKKEIKPNFSNGFA